MSFDFAGEVVVTGGAGDIGKAFAALAAERGADLVVVSGFGGVEKSLAAFEQWTMPKLTWLRTR